MHDLCMKSMLCAWHSLHAICMTCMPSHALHACPVHDMHVTCMTFCYHTRHYDFTSKQNIHRLQMVQNQLVRVVSGSGYRQSAAPILLSLLWLPVQRRIEYKIVNMVFKSRMNSLPEYLSRGLVVHTSVRPIRSSLSNTYVVPRVRLEVAKQSFTYAGAKLWNELPNGLRSTISYTEFKKLVKTHYFSLHFNWLFPVIRASDSLSDLWPVNKYFLLYLWHKTTIIVALCEVSNSQPIHSLIKACQSLGNSITNLTLCSNIEFYWILETLKGSLV